MTVSAARAVADAVLYEGYLIYPYRASAAKNRSRWQFEVLGPPSAAPSAFAEPPAMATQCLLTPGGHVTVHLRFLHLQVRDVEQTTAGGGYRPVHSLAVADEAVLSWDEAVEHEVTIPPGVTDAPVVVPGWSEITPLSCGGAPPFEPVGRIVRRPLAVDRRRPLVVDARRPADPPHRHGGERAPDPGPRQALRRPLRPGPLLARPGRSSRSPPGRSDNPSRQPARGRSERRRTVRPDRDRRDPDPCG